ncbi:hypothetical protein P4U43_13795 [Arthrobacter sp. EH-1B-1]|uniref:STAS domain-containing protein n=1 Tax=Arthrobacter vasquezii TaxID=2977629 RepID=A0ABT6CXX7_9MICC|nr:hypothetical protein [Arthrobacter vasquezii]MDF9278859.1 hypothetical protein [Arthrobacter vasquezii]
MDHKLRVLVRLDVDRTAAVIAVNGCLTEINYRALLPIARRACALIGGLSVTVDLTGARHIEGNSIDSLERALSLMSASMGASGKIMVQAPSMLPVCPALTLSRQMQEVAA